MVSNKICSVKDCGRPHQGKTFCNKHYQQYRKGHDPHSGPPSRKKPIKHGTLYGYQGRNCRCTECTAAATSYMRVRAGGSPPKLATPKYGVKPSTNNRTRNNDKA